ncbi:CMGC kinase [Babesia caballi]|uniref:Cyclin-dependent kinase 2 homolog n=1 Tax=Babesia caballi TaxID=5871 RepID=A0AAV4LQM9_BABCB|nr:CMGC kinase [Babesia caballi]
MNVFRSIFGRDATAPTESKPSEAPVARRNSGNGPTSANGHRLQASSIAGDSGARGSHTVVNTARAERTSTLQTLGIDMEVAETFREGVRPKSGTRSSGRGSAILGDVEMDTRNQFFDALDLGIDSSASLEEDETNIFRDPRNNAIRSITDVLSFDKPLGKGVYGDVFLCHLRADNRKAYAVKRIQQAPSPVEKIFGIDQNIVKELHALRALKRPHANIVRLYDFCSTIEAVVPRHPSKENHKAPKRKCLGFYLVFELCHMDLYQFLQEASRKYKAHQRDLLDTTNQHTNGENRVEEIINQWCTLYLKGRKAEPGRDNKIPLPALHEDVVKVIMYQILQGLQYIHSQRIIHRDIKPQNILLKKEEGKLFTTEALRSPKAWQVKIGDLGLSTIVPVRYLGTMTEEVVTLLYRPPELLLGDCKYTTAVDIWSTAASVGECLLGKPMFRARTEFSVLMRIICTVGCPNAEEMPEFAKQLKYLTANMPKVERDARSSLRKLFTDHFGRQLLSETGLDLFVKMLQFVPARRITAEQALRHPWFEDINGLLMPAIAESYQNLEQTFPKGQRDMLPLPFKGKLGDFQEKLSKARLKETSVDDPYMQFVFP